MRQGQSQHHQQLDKLRRIVACSRVKFPPVCNTIIMNPCVG
jgi:hypothetical protein